MALESLEKLCEGPIAGDFKGTVSGQIMSCSSCVVVRMAVTVKGEIKITSALF